MVKQADIDALHAIAPADFVAARNALVKRARAAKQDALAREIAALRKPNAVVWLTNQLARRHPDDTAALIEAGRGLRQAQRAMVRGGGAAALRGANQAWRSAVSRALKSMRVMAGQAIDEPRIVATLLAAATDPDETKRLGSGTLTAELAPPGIETALGEIGEAGPALRRRQAVAAVDDTAKDRQAQREDRKRQRVAAAALRQRERRAAAARQAAERAERAAARLEQRTAEAAERAARARAEAAVARRRAAELESK